MCFWCVCVCVCVCWGEFSKYVPWRITIVTSILTRGLQEGLHYSLRGRFSPSCCCHSWVHGASWPRSQNREPVERTGADVWSPVTNVSHWVTVTWPCSWGRHQSTPQYTEYEEHGECVCVCVCVCCSITVHAVHDNSGKQGAVVNYVTC